MYRIFSILESALTSASISILWLLVSILIIINIDTSNAMANTVNIVEIVPHRSPDYGVNQELNQINLGVEVAYEDFTNQYGQQCKCRLNKIIDHGTEDELYRTIKKIAVNMTTDDNSYKKRVIVGISRTNFARLAANAASRTSLLGISMGAATTKLREINPNFVSIVSPWEKQWETIVQAMKESNCLKENTIGIFDKENILSNNFQEAYMKSFKNPNKYWINIATDARFSELITNKSCIFFGTYFSLAKHYLQLLASKHWKGTVFGTGDWNYFSKEVKNTLREFPSEKIKGVIAPTGWKSNNSEKIKAFVKKLNIKRKIEISPAAVYAYDATIIGMATSCNLIDSRHYNYSLLKKLPLLREYYGIASSGNYLSAMYLVDFKKE
ncbi:MAG: hypothetical protein HQK53_19555 [Oligoflexia bacterium]|nr:hypothetical protein [Oligoflexia bacterium]